MSMPVFNAGTTLTVHLPSSKTFAFPSAGSSIDLDDMRPWKREALLPLLLLFTRVYHVRIARLLTRIRKPSFKTFEKGFSQCTAGMHRCQVCLRILGKE